MCPQRVRAALEFLQKVNPLYADVLISDKNINPDLLSIGKKTFEREVDFEIESDDELEETTSNPLNKHRHAADESLVIENENLIEIAPGEDKNTKHILFDKKCEELAFPKIFFKGKFGYTYPREHYLTPTRYFNQRLLNFSQTFASNSDYIFFAQSVLQQKNFNDQINIAMKKVTGQLTAGMFANYNESVRRFVSNDQGFLFMNQIKETPAYWKKFQREVLAMVKQLGCPTFFLTLSCADLRWNELIEIISKLNSLGLTKEDVEGLNYFERCNVLNSNAVLLARHFQHRVEIFFKEVLIIRDGPLEKVKYYAI